MNNKMDCQYCKNTFINKPTLKYHQKTAKYCISIQGIKNTNYECESCKKTFSTKQNLQVHKTTCTSNILSEIEGSYKNEIIKISDDRDKQIEKLEKTIKDLQNTIEKLASQAISRSTTTKNTQINNYIQQLQPVTDDILKDNAQNLTIDHILKGPEGYAQYALEYPLKDRMLCVDYARRKVKFKDPNGNVITDPEMTNLATKFFISINDKNKELIIEYGNKLKENFGDEMDTIIQILDYKLDVQKSSDGEKCDFHHDFVKQICSKTIME